jgi:hypothetical protein
MQYQRVWTPLLFVTVSLMCSDVGAPATGAGASGISKSRFLLPCARYKSMQIKKHEARSAVESWDESILSYIRRECCIPEIVRAVRLCVRNPHVAWAVLRVADKQTIHTKYCETWILESIPEDGESEIVDYHYYFLRRAAGVPALSSDALREQSEKMTEIAALVLACMVKHFPHIMMRCVKEAVCVGTIPIAAFLSAYLIFVYSDSVVVPASNQWALWGII